MGVKQRLAYLEERIAALETASRFPKRAPTYSRLVVDFNARTVEWKGHKTKVESDCVSFPILDSEWAGMVEP